MRNYICCRNSISNNLEEIIRLLDSAILFTLLIFLLRSSGIYCIYCIHRVSLKRYVIQCSLSLRSTLCLSLSTRDIIVANVSFTSVTFSTTQASHTISITINKFNFVKMYRTLRLYDSLRICHSKVHLLLCLLFCYKIQLDIPGVILTTLSMKLFLMCLNGVVRETMSSRYQSKN